MKVDFLVAGAQKCGTTALDGYLREHPEICMAIDKEVHFFDNDELFIDGNPDYVKFYHSHFAPHTGCEMVGEVTPIYMYWRPAPERIYKYNPDIKFIILLRNPIERAYSHWNMERRRGLESTSFSDAIRCEIEQLRRGVCEQHRIHSYCDRGFYTAQLERLWHYFSRDQVFVLKSEWLLNAPVRTLDAIYDFLDVSVFKITKARMVHDLPYDEDMSDEDRKTLRNLFSTEINNLEKILGWDCADWL